MLKNLRRFIGGQSLLFLSFQFQFQFRKFEFRYSFQSLEQMTHFAERLMTSTLYKRNHLIWFFYFISMFLENEKMNWDNSSKVNKPNPIEEQSKQKCANRFHFYFSTNKPSFLIRKITIRKSYIRHWNYK